MNGKICLVTRRYFRGEAEARPSATAQDEKLARRLWDVSTELAYVRRNS